MLIFLPGILFITHIRIRKYIGNLDHFQGLPIAFIFGISIWLPISTLAYAIGVSTEVLINVVICFIFLYSIKFRGQLFNIFLYRNYFSLLNLYFYIVLLGALFVGYIAQFQTGDSDAFAHIASMRNLANSENIASCDWILGGSSPMAAAYGCNPWYLIGGMIARLSGEDVAQGYQTLCGILFFLSVITAYALIKEISQNEYLAKVCSIYLMLASIFNWLIIIGNNNYYSLDPLNNLIFPQHLISYILFPTTLIFLIRYLKCRLVSDLILTLGCFLVVSRIHPSWLFWSPILLVGILFFNTFFLKNKETSWVGFIKLFLIIFCLSLISVAGYMFCNNTYSTDVNIISPIAHWRASGGNLLFISNYIYLYHPMSYFSERAIFDFGTILLLRYLAGNLDITSHATKNKSRIYTFNLLFWVYLASLASVFLVVFNPLVTFLVINYLNSSVVLYRSFSLITPFLGCITIYAILSFLKLILSAKYFRISTVIAFILIGLILLFWKADYLEALYQNKGGYYSTYHSINAAPFSYFRKLEPGVIIIDAPMATPVAALTELDPIITEVWRAKSTEDIYINKKDNDALLSFSLPKDELLEIINRRNVQYIYLSKNNLMNSPNFKKYPELVHLKLVIDGDELWEINKGLL